MKKTLLIIGAVVFLTNCFKSPEQVEVEKQQIKYEAAKKARVHLEDSLYGSH